MNDNSIAARRQRMMLWMPVLVAVKEDWLKQHMCPICKTGRLKIDRKTIEGGTQITLTCAADPSHTNTFLGM